MSSAWSLVDEAVSRFADEQVALRRHLHCHPELSGQEVETTRFVAEKLRAAGLEPQILADGLGLWADVTLGTPTAQPPRIALRADLDALPIQDEKSVAYRSTVPGSMHACGHDGHTAVVVGAARAATAVQAAWRESQAPPLALRFLFQPAEETAAGARSLVEQGVLDGVAAALAVHMEPAFPAGHVGVRYGVLTAACDEVRITITGHAGHAARPHLTRDPVLAAAGLVTALYSVLPRRVDARKPAVFSIAKITAGRTHNAIPDRADLSGTLRTIDPDVRAAMLEHIAEVCAGVATMTGTTIVPAFHRALPSVVNDSRAAAALQTAATEVLGAEQVTLIDLPSMGGEDFAYYLRQVPGAMLRLGCTPPGATPQHLHGSRFDIDERALSLGSRVLLRAAAVLAEVLTSSS